MLRSSGQTSTKPPPLAPSLLLRSLPRPTSSRLLPIIADYLDATSKTSAFEQLAGRSAMLATSLALTFELVVDELRQPGSPPTLGLFTSISSPSIAATIASIVVIMAASLAVMSKKRGGARLLEGVYVSLTSRSIGDPNFNLAMDDLFDVVLTPSFIEKNFDIDV